MRDVSQREIDGYVETVEYLTGYSTRQGRLIASILDYLDEQIYRGFDIQKNPIMNNIYKDLKNHLIVESEYLNKRINQARKSGH